MTDTLFIRLLHHEDKGAALVEKTAALREGRADGDIYTVNPDSFRQVPNTPFCYWVSERIRRLFKELPPFEGEGRTVKQGLATADDFRFVRNWWECSPQMINIKWFPYVKGGATSLYYQSIQQVVAFADKGREIASRTNEKGMPYSNIWMLKQTIEGFFFRPGITWSRRASRFCPRALPSGCIFSVRGESAFLGKRNLGLGLGLCASSVFDYLFKICLGRFGYPEFVIGVLKGVPVPEISGNQEKCLSEYGRRGWTLKYSLDIEDTSHAFTLPALLRIQGGTLTERVTEYAKRAAGADAELLKIQEEIDEIAFHLYGLGEEEREAVVRAQTPGINDEELEANESVDDDEVDESTLAEHRITSAVPYVTDLLSWCVSVAFGRFDVRLALNPSLVPGAPDPFDPLPVCPPGMLVGPDGRPAKPRGIVSEAWLRARPDANTLPPDGSVSKPTIPDSEYPLRINWDGILVDDPGFNGNQPHRDDIVRRVREVFDLLWKDRAYEIEQEACGILGVRDLRDYFRKPSGFFQDHLRRYSKSRRKAPIYWPLSTASGSYTIWIYYHRLTDQTLYATVNKYVEPKIAEVERTAARIEEELKSASGRDAARLTDRLNETRAFLGELRDLRGELLRIAALPYRPDLNDGVVINAAPLHNLFRLRSWAKETEKVWKKLEKGDYDWARMAYTIWPDRVREVCRRDRSIAVAHGLEDLCEVEAPAPKKKGGRGRRKREAAG